MNIWNKVVIALGAITGTIIYSGWSVARHGNPDGGIVCIILAAVILLVAVMIMGISSLKPPSKDETWLRDDCPDQDR